VSGFLKNQKQFDAAAYADALPKLDWVLVTRPPDEGGIVEVPAEQLRDVQTTFLLGRGFDQTVHHRTDKMVNLAVDDGAPPDPAVAATENYGVRWEGQLVPPRDGTYTLVTQSSGGVRLSVDGKDLFDTLKGKGNQTNRARLDLKAGQAVPFQLEFHQQRGAGRCKLMWAAPEVNAPDPAKLLARVRDDGTTLLILDRADTWMDLIAKNATTPIKYAGTFTVGRTWLGGEHFVKEHPLFKDLPVNCAMDWPYQAVVRDGNARYGLLLEGEELVAGAYHCYPMRLGTAVGVIPCGKGRIVVSTLDICDNLASREEPANVARKLLCNFIEYATESR
jgi:hypothetical protein